MNEHSVVDALAGLFAAVENKAAFARQWKVPGGASMISQHLSGHRPVSFEAALVYAKAFAVPLSTISPTLAKMAQEATDTEEKLPAPGGSSAKVVPLSSISAAVSAFLSALRALPTHQRDSMQDKWKALLMAPDSAELERWLMQALRARPWDEVTERRHIKDRRGTTPPQAPGA